MRIASRDCQIVGCGRLNVGLVIPRSSGARAPGDDPRAMDMTVWPEGKAFAFTVFDDTDNATIDNVGPVYDFLTDLGFRTTKSVWPVQGPDTPRIGGSTSADLAYREWTLDLQRRGFEIGSHGATFHTSDRALVTVAMTAFRDIYGHDPMTFANHSGCAESIYWGEYRVSGAARAAYNLMTRRHTRGMFRGHCEGDRLFWGDLCREHVRYVRNFTFTDIDTLAACPQMPYFDPQRPYVNAWFASTEGANVRAFTERITEEAQDRLEERGGACIMYTHFASGFATDGGIDPTFERLMRRLASRNGWFVPASTLLDHIRDRQGLTVLSDADRRRLELRWLFTRARRGST